jgi:hypothetical protein
MKLKHIVLYLEVNISGLFDSKIDTNFFEFVKRDPTRKLN